MENVSWHLALFTECSFGTRQLYSQLLDRDLKRSSSVCKSSAVQLNQGP
jgi:hypothetical protein